MQAFTICAILQNFARAMNNIFFHINYIHQSKIAEDFSKMISTKNNDRVKQHINYLYIVT